MLNQHLQLSYISALIKIIFQHKQNSIAKNILYIFKGGFISGKLNVYYTLE